MDEESDSDAVNSTHIARDETMKMSRIIKQTEMTDLLRGCSYPSQYSAK
jgi:hypothetical protein